MTPTPRVPTPLLKRLYAEGLTCREIAQRVGYGSGETVRGRLKAAGVSLRPGGAPRMDRAQMERIRAAYESGDRVADIAESEELCERAVYNRLERMGVRMRKAWNHRPLGMSGVAAAPPPDHRRRAGSAPDALALTGAEF